MIKDMAFFTIMLFAIGVSFVIAFIVSDNINDAIQGIDDMPADAKTDMDNFNTKFPTVFDWAFLTILVGAFAGMLLLVWYLPVNPVVFFVSILITTLLAAVAGYLANAFLDMKGTSALGASITNFPIIDFVLSNYLVFVLIFGFVTIIVFFSKPGGVQ